MPHTGTEPGNVRPIGREPVPRPCVLRQQEGIGERLAPIRQRAYRAALPCIGTEPGSERPIGREPVRRPCTLRQQEGPGSACPNSPKGIPGSAAPPHRPEVCAPSGGSRCAAPVLCSRGRGPGSALPQFAKGHTGQHHPVLPQRPKVCRTSGTYQPSVNKNEY